MTLIAVMAIGASATVVMTVAATVSLISATVWASFSFRALDIAFGFIEEFAVGDFDFALIVDADDNDFEGIADIDDVGDFLNVVPA